MSPSVWRLLRSLRSSGWAGFHNTMCTEEAQHTSANVCPYLAQCICMPIVHEIKASVKVHPYRPLTCRHGLLSQCRVLNSHKVDLPSPAQTSPALT